MQKKLNEIAWATSASIVAAFAMLVLGIAGNFGLYTGAVNMMQQWHMFFSLSISGILAGMIEAAIITFVFMYPLAKIYNSLNKNGKI